jgi:hypothetical protein
MRFLAAIDLGSEQGIRLSGFLLERDGQLLCAERLDRTERRVGLRIEFLRRRERLDIRPDLALLLLHPLLQFVLLAGAARQEDAAADEERRRMAARRHGFAHGLAPGFALTAVLRTSSISAGSR